MRRGLNPTNMVQIMGEKCRSSILSVGRQSPRYGRQATSFKQTHSLIPIADSGHDV
jgi:hypothetical protein